MLAIQPETGVNALGFVPFFSTDKNYTIFLVETIGTVTLGNFLTSYLIESNKTVCHKAIAVGLATRIVKSFSIINRLRKLSLKTKFVELVRILGSLGVILLITGSNKVGDIATYTLSVVSGGIGLAMYIQPVMIASILFGLNVEVYGE